MGTCTHKVLIEVLISEPHLDEEQLRQRWLGKLEEKCPNWDVELVKVEKV